MVEFYILNSYHILKDKRKKKKKLIHAAKHESKRCNVKEQAFCYPYPDVTLGRDTRK